MKLVTIIGARPQFIKASTISDVINSRHKSFSEVIIHTGQHFDENMSKIFFDEMEIPRPRYNLNVNNLAYNQMIDTMIGKIVPILKNEKADALLVYGDTNSTLAGSIAGKLCKLPVIHIEAGLRSFNRAMPEENNRIISDHLSTLLFCPTKNSVENLKKENLTKSVFFSGDIMFDAFLKYSSKKDIANERYFENEFILSTIHRRENISDPKKLIAIFNNLDRINEEKKIIMPLHPHTAKKINEYDIKSKITFIEPQGYISNLSLLKKCSLVITDSGGLQKESFFSKKKCLVIRNQTEWIELVDKKTNLLSSQDDIFNKYKKLIKKEFEFSYNIFGNGKASQLIIDKIENYFSN